MKRVFSYLFPYRYRMAAGFCIKVLGTLAELLLPVVLTHILKSVVVKESLSLIFRWGVLMLLFAGIACAFNIIANRMAATVGKRFSEALRRDLFYRTLTLDTAQTDAFTIPSLESRITTDTYHVHNFVMMIQRMGIRAPILLIGGVVITLLMDATLALVMLAVMPFIFLFVYLLSRIGVRLYARVQTSVDGLVRILREDFGGIRVIKALSKEGYEEARFEEANQKLSKHEQTASFIMSGTHPIMNLLMNGGIAAVTALAATRVANGTSDAETVVAFMQYFTLISMALMAVSRMFVMFSKCTASARRISEVLSSPYEILPEDFAGEEKDENFVEMRNVSFSYTTRRKKYISDISFAIPYGSSFGIIGGTGSGKSTLIKLLLRFYDANEGEILFRGKNIKAYKREEIAPFIGVAHQKDFLYADTVAENIRFGRPLSEEEINTAIAIAQAKDFVDALPQGINTPLATGGTNLSGGQRQRLLIARAVAGIPPLLILDDASSALDYKTDAALRGALRAFEGKMTTITVAQRVSSVMSCDKILVLDEGKSVGYGTHADLMENCPIYREISDSQMGGALFE